MNFMEQPVEIGGSKPLEERLRKIIDSPPSSDYMLRQIQLVAELCKRKNPGVELNHDLISEEMKRWSSSKYSKAFNSIYESEGFKTKTHLRLKGEIANITLEDVEYWIENGNLKDD